MRLEEIAMMIEADLLLDTLEARVPENEELRDGLRDLIFDGPLREEFADAFEMEREHHQDSRDPPAGMGHP